MRRVVIGSVFLSVALLTLSGCGHVGKRLGIRSDYGGCACDNPGSSSRILTPRPAPVTPEPPATGSQPPGRDIYDPLTPYPAPNDQAPIPEERIPPGPVETERPENNGPQETWRPPIRPRVELSAPTFVDPNEEPKKRTTETPVKPSPKVEEKVETNKEEEKPEAKLMPPISPDEGKQEEKTEKKQPEADPEPLFSTFPPDIPQFARVKSGVYSGEKPWAEGLNWLKDKEFRTVVHLHGPSEDTAVVRKQFELKGFRYVGLAVSPETLNLKLVDQFNHVITDSSNHRMFVFDRDGSLAGPLWFLHFRMIARLSNEQALEKASEHGLRRNNDDFNRRMMLATQKILEGKN